jgi:hypothetical protein
MNVIFLSPHFPPAIHRYCARLRDLGATVLGIADAPWDQLRPEVRASLAEYYRVSDLHDYDQLVRAVGYFTHRYGRIDRIDSLNEYWLETEAHLRTDFNVFGIRDDTIGTVKRKSAMKRVFEMAGIAVARGRVASTAEEVRDLVAEVGYPVIAKPDIGVGAARTWRIETEADLAAYLREGPPRDYILEECLDGELLTYDGLVDRGGAVVFDSSLVYGIPVLDVVEGGDMEYWIDREIAPDLVDAGARILAAFDVRERLFHFEFFRRPNGELAALEVNMRQPGGITVDLWNWANEADIYRAWAETVVRGTSTVVTERPYYCLWAGRKGGRAYHLDHDAVMARFGDLVIHVEQVDDVFAAAIGNVGYVLRGTELEPLRDACAEIQARA